MSVPTRPQPGPQKFLVRFVNKANRNEKKQMVTFSVTPDAAIEHCQKALKLIPTDWEPQVHYIT